MAAGQSRVAQAIRAIVLDIIKDRRDEDLTEQQKRDRILGKRGIGYMFPDGVNAGGISGTTGLTQLGPGLGNLSDFTTNEQLQHVLDAIENAPKSAAQALNNPIGGKAMAIDGLMDCETGKEVEIVNTKEFKLPPDWENETTPAVTNPIRWEQGIRWSAATSPVTSGTTADEVAQAAAGNLGGGGGGWSFDSYIDPASIGCGSQFAAKYTGPAGAIATLCINKAVCAVGIDTFCPATHAPIPWPVDNKMQLARNAQGQFVSSVSEPPSDVVPDFTDNQHSRLDLCFSDGSGRKVTVEATHNGGWMIYERDPSTGESIGTATIHNQNNVVIAKMDASEDNLRGQRPVDLFI